MKTSCAKMEKAILLNLKSEQVEKILNKEKTLELRNSVPKNFTGWVYIYVRKAKPYLAFDYVSFEDCWRDIYLRGGYCTVNNVGDFDRADINDVLNGKVVARFWFDEYDALIPYTHDNLGFNYHYETIEKSNKELHRKLCLSKYEVGAYGKGKRLYAWHIKKLEIFDKPKELSEFYIYANFSEATWRTLNYEGFKEWAFIKKAPPNWKSVYVESKIKE